MFCVDLIITITVNNIHSEMSKDVLTFLSQSLNCGKRHWKGSMTLKVYKKH